MAAPKGNRFWEARSSHGRNPKFDDPGKLWDACVQYFQWVEDNPLIEDKVSQFQGNPVHMPVAKMRAMTIKGLCLFIDVTYKTWQSYKENEDLLAITTRAEDIIYNHKFTGAAAELLNANIIARDLGLKDQRDLSSSDGSMTPKCGIDLSALSDEALQELMNARDKAGDK